MSEEPGGPYLGCVFRRRVACHFLNCPGNHVSGINTITAKRISPILCVCGIGVLMDGPVYNRYKRRKAILATIGAAELMMLIQ